MAEITSLAQGITILNQMEQALSPEQFIAWLDARPGSELVYRYFVLDHTEDHHPPELVITPSTTLAEAYPQLAKQHQAWLATQSNTYRNGADHHSYRGTA